MTLPITAAWVWHAVPRAVPDLDAVFVRCANGAATSGAGFDYAANYRAWRATGRVRVVPWTWFGPPASSNGAACAETLVEVAPDQPAYIVEVGFDPAAGEVLALVERLRQLAPRATLCFSSYPTRAQAERFGVPWEACVAAFDVGVPQVYLPQQREHLLRPSSPVVADMRGKPIHVAVFPDGDAGWRHSARAGVLHHLGASGWSVDQASFVRWRRELGALGGEMPISDADVERIAERVAARLGDELAERVVAAIESKAVGGRGLTHDDIVADVKRALREGTGAAPGSQAAAAPGSQAAAAPGSQAGTAPGSQAGTAPGSQASAAGSQDSAAPGSQLPGRRGADHRATWPAAGREPGRAKPGA